MYMCAVSKCYITMQASLIVDATSYVVTSPLYKEDMSMTSREFNSLQVFST